MTFPEFCAREARRSTLLLVGLLVAVVGAFGYLAYKRKQEAAAGSEERGQ